MLTLTPKDGGPGVLSYAPQSDLRHCGPGMVAKVMATFAGAFEEGGEPRPWLAALAADAGGTVADLAKACDAMAWAVARALEDPDATLQVALADSGFLAAPRGIQEAIAAQIGRQALGMTIHAIRATTPLGVVPSVAIAELLEAGRKVAEAIGPARP